MDFVLTPNEVAGLFILFEQPVPPNVADALTGWRRLLASSKWEKVSTSLVKKGLVLIDGENRPIIEPNLAEVLGACFAADTATATDYAGKIGPVFYRYGNTLVTVVEEGDGFRLAKFDDLAVGPALVADILGDKGSGEAAETYSVVMSLSQFNEVLSEAKGSQAGLKALCTANEWDYSAVNEILDRVLSRADLRLVTHKPGHELEVDTRLVTSAGTVWAIRVAIGPEASQALLVRTSPNRMFEIVTDVRGAYEDGYLTRQESRSW